MDLKTKIFIGGTVAAVGFVAAALVISSVKLSALQEQCEAHNGVFLSLRNGYVCVKKDIIIPNP